MYKRRPKCHRRCKQGRHVFSREECKRGFQAAKAKIDARHPDWKCQHGKNLSHCLLRVKEPQWFTMREVVEGLERQVDEIEKRQGRDNAKLQRIRKELRALKRQGQNYNGDLRTFIGDGGMIESEGIQ